MDSYQKLHGTTVDSFKIGVNNQRITLTGQTTTGSAAVLLDRNGQSYTATSTVFFTAYIVGTGTNTAAYTIKGCYIPGSGVNGYVIDTFVDTNNFTRPTITFPGDILTLTVTGQSADTINWSATVDLITI
jgi:hypothetical protein